MAAYDNLPFNKCDFFFNIYSFKRTFFIQDYAFISSLMLIIRSTKPIFPSAAEYLPGWSMTVDQQEQSSVYMQCKQPHGPLTVWLLHKALPHVTMYSIPSRQHCKLSNGTFVSFPFSRYVSQLFFPPESVALFDSIET